MFGISKHGFKRKTYDDILQELMKRSRDTFGENINLTSRSLYGMMLRVVAWVVSGLWQLAESVYLSGYVRYAEGVQLDRIAGNIGIRRQGKISAEGYVNVYVDKLPTIIPAGFIVESVTGQRYISVKDETITEQGGTIKVVAVDKGYHTNTEANSIIEIVTPTAEVERVTNLEAIVGGRDEESDAEFRARYYKSRGATGSSTRASIEASLRDIESVRDAVVIENDTKVEVNNLPPHHIHCLIVGGNDDVIGKTILSTKAAGIGTMGDTEVTVDGYTVRFDKGTHQQITIKLVLTVDSDYSDSYEDLINERVMDYILTIGLGGTIHRSKLVMELADIPGITNVDVILDGKNEDLILNSKSIPSVDKVVIEYA